MPRPITSVLVKPTSADCNLDCSYCFYTRKSTLYPESKVHRMSDEVMDSMIRQVMELRRQSFSFGWQGGEPTLMGLGFFEKAVEAMKKYGRPGQSIGNGLQTNGVVLDDDWGTFLHKYHFLVGLSLDGPAKYHDKYRLDHGGQPTHARVMNAVEVLRRHNVEFNCLVVVNADNVQDPDGVFDFFRDHDLHHLQFIPAIERKPEGGPGELAEFTAAGEEFGRFMCRIFDRWREDDPPTFCIRWFDNLILHHAGQPTASCTMKPTCGDYVVVEHNGDVYPCDFFVDKHWRLGYLMQTPIEELATCRNFERFCKQKGELVNKCRNCKWLELCYGGCTKDRLAISDDPKTATYLCQGYKIFFEHTMQTFKAMGMHHRRQMQPSPIVTPQGYQRGGDARSPGRNAPCPCGRGQKFKHCCLEGRGQDRARDQPRRDTAGPLGPSLYP